MAIGQCLSDCTGGWSCFYTAMLNIDDETVRAVRAMHGLDAPGRMDEAVRLLADWIMKQAHFKKKDFEKRYLETTIISCKGSIEKSKSRIDSHCTFRTLMPTLFDKIHATYDFIHLHKFIHAAICPQFTKEYYRVVVIKVLDYPITTDVLYDFYKYCMIMVEYVKSYDYLNGVIILIDYLDANLTNILSKISLVDLQQATLAYLKGYGIRIKGIHLLSTSKLVQSVVSILKQLLSKKLCERINVHNNIDSLYTYIPKDILPSNYGGKEKSVKDLDDEWIKLFSAEEYIQHLICMTKASTDEKKRTKEKFNANYLGMPGTFRSLDVD